jgi:glutamine synthetase
MVGFRSFIDGSADRRIDRVDAPRLACGAMAGTTEPDPAVAEQTQAALAGAGVQVVACTFVDLAGVTRIKGVPVERFADAVRHGVGMSFVSTVFTVDDQIASSPGFDSPTGDMRLRPDPDGVVVLDDAPGWAWAPVNQDSQDLRPMSGCPRAALSAAVDRAAEQGLTFRTAFEVEFNLLDADGRAVHRGPGYGARALFDAGDFAVDLVAVLGSQGLAVQQIHPEYTTSQYEISIAPASPVQAADRHGLLRATVVRVARRHGYEVSFAPVAMAGTVGNGSHVHLSAWRGDDNLMHGGDEPCGMTRTGEAFAAGVLHHLPDLSAVLTPSVLSYARLEPSHWSAPFTCWGPENREAAVRYVSGTAGTRARAANIEVKPLDASANPYLAQAVIIAAGMDGMDRGLQLPEPVLVDPATFGEDEREARGIHRLPRDLEAAMARMASSQLVRGALGEPLFEAFLAVRRLEWDTFGSADLTDVIAAHRWRYG